MRYLLSDILTHIENPPLITKELVEKISSVIAHSIAELDFIIEIPIKECYIAEVKEINNNNCAVFIKEMNAVLLPWHNGISKDNYYVVIKENDQLRWLTLHDCYSTKDGYFPAVDSKTFKNFFSDKDYIFVIDNKSIGHRSDLWSLYGLAREIAAFLDFTLKPYSTDDSLITRQINSDNLAIETDAVLYASTSNVLSISEEKSDARRALSLALSDIRPRSYLVDLSNYIMLHYGHPLHIFDAHGIKKIIFKQGYGDTLSLIDKTEIKLNTDDIVVSSYNKPLSLAGIMGGTNSCVTDKTESIIIEAAYFDAKTIRYSSNYHQKKTDSAQRFEKNLTAYGSFYAVYATIKLLIEEKKIECGILYETMTIYPDYKNNISCNYDDISRWAGMPLTDEYCRNALEKLGFKIESYNETDFICKVPWWRNDIMHAQDCAEEIMRLIPLHKIKPFSLALPLRSDNYHMMTIYNVKKTISTVIGCNETVTYGIMHDKERKNLNYSSKDEEIVLKNPYSSEQSKLVSTLIPHLVGIIKKKIDIYPLLEDYRIFEIAPTFIKKNGIVEEKTRIGIAWYQKNKDQYNFYRCKKTIETMHKALGLSCRWNKSDDIPSFMSLISANIYHENNCMGYAGFIDPQYSYSLFLHHGSLFVYECDYDYCINVINKNVGKISSIVLNKEYYTDISFFINKEKIVMPIIKLLQESIQEISNIKVIDWLDRDEWNGKRSVTLRCFHKQSDSLYKNIAFCLTDKGYEVR